MNREFWDLYDKELKLLNEQVRDYAAEFPGIAERLGGLTGDERMDPGLIAILEGSAFLAARVQLKLKSEFSEFTTNLLDQLLPNFLAPTPSSLLVQATPPYENPLLLKGVTHKAGAYMDATYVERERRVACRYRLGADLTLWPLRMESAAYFSSAAQLQALGLEILPGTSAGLRLSFLNRLSAPEDDRLGAPPLGQPVDRLDIETLPIHLVGNPADNAAIYEQLFTSCRRIMIRYEDEYGDPHFAPLPLDRLEQIGFDEDDTLYPGDERSFSGFDLLRDYFMFPAKYAGFKIGGLRAPLSRIKATGFDVLFEFDNAVPALAPIVTRDIFALYAAPASNLFAMQCARIPVDSREHEHQVIPDRSRWLDYEAHRVMEVYAHYPGRSEKVPVYPLYSLPDPGQRLDDALYYTVRRLPRVKTEEERRFGSRSNYAGTELFLSLFEPAGLEDSDRVKELSVRALVSNRHLPEQLPVGEGGADFSLLDDAALDMRCLVGPTPPRDSVVHADRKQREPNHPGPVMWRLINFLALNHLGLSDPAHDDRAAGLREVLALFANMSDVFSERQVRGIEKVSSRPIVRRLRQPTGFNAARGIELTITFDERNFEGHGIIFLGAVLDRFLAEYASINSFTETVIASTQRGVIKRWPPRSGRGGVL
jgi:type VI secretion system protein ImpG